MATHKLISILAAALAGIATYAQASPVAKTKSSDAAYLGESFRHNLCARNDRDLQKLNKALSAKPANILL